VDKNIQEGSRTGERGVTGRASLAHGQERIKQRQEARERAGIIPIAELPEQ